MIRDIKQEQIDYHNIIDYEGRSTTYHLPGEVARFTLCGLETWSYAKTKPNDNAKPTCKNCIKVFKATHGRPPVIANATPPATPLVDKLKKVTILQAQSLCLFKPDGSYTDKVLIAEYGDSARFLKELNRQLKEHGLHLVEIIDGNSDLALFIEKPEPTPAPSPPELKHRQVTHPEHKTVIDFDAGKTYHLPDKNDSNFTECGLYTRDGTRQENDQKKRICNNCLRTL